MFRGRHTLGKHIPLGVRCLDSSGQPAAPVACPLMDVFDASDVKVLSRRIPIMDSPAVAGLFQYRLFLNAIFSEGQYLVVYHYQVGSDHGLDCDSFEVVPGGDADGAVISMFDYLRPQGRFIVHQTDAGKLKRGRNPRL